MIDRSRLLSRHRVVITKILPRSPLAVGNGEFAFTVDVTGLQTIPGDYPLPDRYGGATGTLLATMSQWAWHQTPAAPGESDGLQSVLQSYPTPHGLADYVDLSGSLSATESSGLTPTETWLRANPHRLDLGRIGLWTADRLPITTADLDQIRQELDLETGVISSRFLLRGRPVSVRTAADPERDAVAVQIVAAPGSPVGIQLAFPYGSQEWGNAADWTQAEAHQTSWHGSTGEWIVDRELDASGYQVRLTGPGLDLRRAGPHQLIAGADSNRLSLLVEFAPDLINSDDLVADDVFSRSTTAWGTFWKSGAAVDLSGSTAPASIELERRIVLSQYLTRVHGSGSLPPAETGLTANSWRGKFHLEMHWWHAAHFALWGRPELLERSLWWYEKIRPLARATAARQHLPGARWPKQVGPEGEETPSDIGPFLVWQQPHPIHLAELVRRAHDHLGADDRPVLERWAPMVFDTAAFMAAFPASTARGYELLPPLIPAQESYGEDRRRICNPTFELAYWSWALKIACQWRHRLGMEHPPEWEHVAARMVSPRVVDGVYAAIDVPPYTLRTDHPSMVAALGVVPPTTLVDPMIMERTLESVLADWDWETAWGWDFPMLAMTATRLGRPELATAALLRPETKNSYLANGNNYQNDSLPLYLPGNGGLLTAVALMAAGWDGAARPQPGFDKDWMVQWEGLVPLPG